MSRFSNVSQWSTSILSDPFMRVLSPSPDETPAECVKRTYAQSEAKRVSDEIDEDLKREKAELKKSQPVKVLLLGQSESGKSTILKNFQMLLAPQVWATERVCWHAVIQLNLICSVFFVLDTLASSPIALGYASLRGRLGVAEQILHRLLSPSTPDEAGNYRKIIAQDEIGRLDFRSSGNTFLPPSQRPQEFSVRAADPWKSRLLRSSSSLSHRPTVLPNSDSTSMKDGMNGRHDVTDILMECRCDMQRLWSDDNVRVILAGTLGGMQIEDLPGFFLNDVARIAAKGYRPSNDDVLRARMRTMGVQEHRITSERHVDSGREWRVYDIGGARCQVTSWLSYFDTVDTIIFLAPISCFDERLAEDPRVNRLEDSFLLWRNLCASRLLAKVQLVLFLNKVDILLRKILSGTSVERYVPSFGDRSNDIQTVCNYFKDEFKRIHTECSPRPRAHFVYFTTATDTAATKITLDIVQDAILSSNLRLAEIF